MMGGMGLFMLLAVLLLIFLVNWLLMSKRAPEAEQKRKNEDLFSPGDFYELDDEGEILPVDEESTRRKS